MKAWPFAKRRKKNSLLYSTTEALAAIRTILNAEVEHVLIVGGPAEPQSVPIDETEKLLRIGWVLSLLDPNLREAMEFEIENRIMLNEIQPAIKPDVFADVKEASK